MHEKKKQLIISEIKYWKENSLLPEQYCDFLITLYGQGEEEGAQESSERKAVLLKERKKAQKHKWLLAMLLGIFSMILFIFSMYPIVVITMAVIILLVLLGLSMRLSIKKSVLLPAIYIGSAYILLLLSLYIWYTFFMENSLLLVGILFLNCALWLFVGRMFKLLYFTISGVVGSAVIIGFLLSQFF